MKLNFAILLLLFFTSCASKVDPGKFCPNGKDKEGQCINVCAGKTVWVAGECQTN
ncbi:MAG: hypothetical protein HN509_14975 [Halobacteriovoraceae bacterium]|nr:hypothetical protein [Halobacteriovoraceae bacterium]MBT5094805.1 hypothetical protein [Halobacteriovoraceae bacterium]